MPLAQRPIDNRSEILNNPHLAEIVSQLQRLLETQGFHPVRHLLLELAKSLVDNGVCEREYVSSTIKRLLKENIRQGEISRRYIHRALPQQYKRNYNKNRVICSLLNKKSKPEKKSTLCGISQRGSAYEIRYLIDTKYLKSILRILFSVLKDENPCIKVIFDYKACRLMALQIGDQNVESGYPWFDLFRDTSRALSVPLGT